jgi:hypothetical protein
MKITETGEEKAIRQCWECLKRRLVCDQTFPHCKKCRKAGKECPGYDEQKPLQWVQPGKVTSRRRKKSSSSKIYPIPTKGTKKPHVQESMQTKALSVTSTSGRDLIDVSSIASPSEDNSVDRIYHQSFFNHIHQQRFYTRSRSTREDEWGYPAEDLDDKVSQELAYFNASMTDKVYSVFAIGNRHDIEEVVANGSQEDAARMVGGEKNPLKRLDRLLRFLQMQDVPSYTYLRCDTNEVVQSVNYCTFILFANAMPRQRTDTL